MQIGFKYAETIFFKHVVQCFMGIKTFKME